jgi:ATP-dependent RNA helicase DeaD
LGCPLKNQRGGGFGERKEMLMQNESVFTSWGLSPETLHSISEMGYKDPTAIQEACIPLLLEQPGDLLALAKTGTGKTAAFGIPLVEKLAVTPQIQALILCPTRELATQVAQHMQALGRKKGLKVTTVLGGESYRKQIDSLRAGPQILVSTPGRLIDLMEQQIVKLNSVKYLILDEADEMLSFGFQDALEAVWDELTDTDVVTWLFSATMSESIRRLSTKYLEKPHQISMVSHAEPSRVDSYAAVIFEEDKEDALALLLQSEPEFYGIIFAQTKKQVSNLEAKMRTMGLKVESLHGDKVQAERTRVLQRMKARKTQILVATDVAARGLDIEDLTHVVNFEIPWDVETYTHRIGRTARAGKTGVVWTFVKPKEAHHLRKFERSLKFQFKSLKIPSIDQVREAQTQKWLQSAYQTLVPQHNLETYKKLINKFSQENQLEISEQTLDWLCKVMQYSKVATDLKAQQPRSFELRSGGSPGGGFDRSDRGDRGSSRGKRFGGRRDRRDGRRDDRDDRREARGGDRGERHGGGKKRFHRSGKKHRR